MTLEDVIRFIVNNWVFTIPAVAAFVVGIARYARVVIRYGKEIGDVLEAYEDAVSEEDGKNPEIDKDEWERIKKEFRDLRELSLFKRFFQLRIVSRIFK